MPASATLVCPVGQWVQGLVDWRIELGLVDAVRRGPVPGAGPVATCLSPHTALLPGTQGKDHGCLPHPARRPLFGRCWPWRGTQLCPFPAVRTSSLGLGFLLYGGVTHS